MLVNGMGEDAGSAGSEKGIHEPKPADKFREDLATQLCNLGSEMSELWEAYRRGKLNDPCDKADGMIKLGFKLADVVIRCADMAGFFGLDLANAVKVKLAYNKSRPLRNGGKLA